MSLLESIAVKPLSKRDIEVKAIGYLQSFQPEALNKPKPVDVERILDYGIQHSHGFSPRIVKHFDNPSIEAQTNLNKRCIEVTDECYDALNCPGRHRFTVCHEIGHVILHFEQLMLADTTLHRKSRAQLKTYEDPEWQAEHFSGAILMPLTTMFPTYIRMVRAGLSFEEVSLEISNQYFVSVSAAATRIKKISQADLASLARNLGILGGTQ